MLAAARATLLGSLSRVDGPDLAPVRTDYLARHETARAWVDFDDFAFYRLDVNDCYFVGGFGAMGWVPAADYRAAAPDPLADAARGILAHMNEDHADALVLYCRAFAGVEARAATMTAVDRLGFHVLAEVDGAVPRASHHVLARGAQHGRHARRAGRDGARRADTRGRRRDYVAPAAVGARTHERACWWPASAPPTNDVGDGGEIAGRTVLKLGGHHNGLRRQWSTRSSVGLEARRKPTRSPQRSRSAEKATICLTRSTPVVTSKMTMTHGLPQRPISQSDGACG